MKVRALGVMLALVAACGGESSKRGSGADDGRGGDANGGGTSAGGTNAASGSGADGTGGTGLNRIYLYDENNYRSLVELSIPTVETASGVDLEVCWTDVVSDLDCAEVDPQNEIDAVAMMRFSGLSEEEVMQTLAAGELGQSSLNGFVNYESAHDSTCMETSSFSNFGTPIDFAEEYVADDNLTYLFMFTRGTQPGTGSVTMVFAKPSVSSTNTELNAPPGCDIRKVTTDLTSSEPVRVPFDGPWIVDWSNITLDGQGNAFVPNDIDVVTLWFVAGATPSTLDDRISELDTSATESYRLEINGARNVNLGQLRNPRDGRAFSSFSGTEAGVWLFGLTCSSCQNPIPRVLAVFEPADAP